MKRLISFFAKLYPKWWRDRYGVEFDALLEDTGATAQTAFNVFSEALLMQLQTWTMGIMALCGVLDVLYAAMNFLMQRPDGSLALRTSISMLVQMGILALAAGICTIAAGIGSSRSGKSWLLVLNGLACSTLGLILTFWKGRLSFSTIALLIVVMAMSIGSYELATARTLRHHPADQWLLGTAGVVSVGFALAFSAFLFGWIKLDPASPAQSLHWLGSYFGFSAICMLGLAVVTRSFPASGKT